MAVTKKMGNAVVRNRIKRVLREFFRLHQQRIPSGLDLVVVPKRHLQLDSLTLSTASEELLPLLGTASRVRRQVTS